MLVKTKPAILLSSYNSLCIQHPHQYNSKSKTSLSSQPPNILRRRTYATHTNPPPSQESQNDSLEFWPKPHPPHKVPTPYQILNIPRGAPYTKTNRFYDLVKLYHPDRHDHPQWQSPSSSQISTHDRVERYRLTLNAHALLSDPTKRSAYDLYGAGWVGKENVLVPDFNYSKEAKEAAMGNATWEDWEQWYDKFKKPGDAPRGGPQSTVYLSNSAFVSLVALLAALGGIGQATRAESMSQSFLAQRNEAHERALAELAKLKGDKSGWTRDERIEMFLRGRDPEAWNDENVRKMLLEMDVCEGGDVGSKNRDNDFARRYGM